MGEDLLPKEDGEERVDEHCPVSKRLGVEDQREK